MSCRHAHNLPHPDDVCLDCECLEPEKCAAHIDPECLHPNMDVVHHFDDDGNHYCPTGFLLCRECGQPFPEPEPYSCHLWGEKL